MIQAYDMGVESLRTSWQAAVRKRQAVMQRADELVREKFRSHIFAKRLSRAVLLLEDTEIVRMTLADKIRLTTGVDVYEASSIEEADQLWSLHRPAVVVVDVHLANGESGLDFLTEVGRGPRAIIYSGYVTGDLAERVARLSHARFVDKGDPDRVAAVAKELLDEAVPEDVSPEIVRQVINAMHDPVLVIRAVRTGQGHLSDMECIFANDSASKQFPEWRRGSRVLSINPSFSSTRFGMRLEYAFDHIEPFDGEVEWEGTGWLLRLVNLGNDQLLVCARRKV